MDKAELQERIRKGEQYVKRTDISDEQRENAEVRLANYYAMLGEMERQEEDAMSPEAPIEPRVLAEMNKCRAILGMPPRAG